MPPAPPPPPPPGLAPPPPMMPSAMPAAVNNQRGLLLQSIREGTKLKKTVTVDKSAPFIPGKTSSVTSNNSISNESSRDVVSNSAHRNHMNVNGGGPPGLGSLFTHGIPKLKPTGLSIGLTNNSSRETPTRGLSTETKARGPPPQPPPASQKPSMLSAFSPFQSASDSTLASVNGTSRPGPPVLPSKPPVGGYGKPNVAPKPPVAKEPVSPNQSTLHPSIGGSLQTLNDNRAGSSQNLSSLDQLNKPSPPPKKISVNGRPGVNRAQSMRAPRSPPVAPTTTPPFPPNAKQNLVKNQSSLHQSQDSLNSRNLLASKTGTLPHNFIQKVAQLPPNTPPPPTPTQSTPTRPPVSRPPPPPSRPPAPSAPPPPPPHRTGHAPPPPAPPVDRLTSAASNSGPPAPPTRNSSMRNGVPSYLTEIETRFSHLFHSVHEFPEPGAYRRVIKNYNTKASANGKSVQQD
ncbi:UNVERIFIED_CONTAM: hypothetical protein PYX00_010091 [Menopon gallinae]|uniref:WH2 domain-containing protein n=1 Tax=Menopon gallinae TaxID=328185 RepID=A0AAW2HE48_9NEOP